MKGFAIAALLLVIGVGAVLYFRRGDHIEPTGRILKVRSVPAENRSIGVLDVRIQNDSDIALEIRNFDLALTTKDGRNVGAHLLPAKTVRQLFQYYPALGEAYNAPLEEGSRIPPRRSTDFMVAAAFDSPDEFVFQRGKLSLTVEDRSHVSFVLLEKSR